MVWVVGPLFAADDVTPPGADAVACLDVDDLVGMSPGNSAGQLLIVDVVDGVWLRGSTEADESALLRAIDGEFLLEMGQRYVV